MLTGIDHLVVVVPDLATAIENYERLGFTVMPGGRHPIATHNALISFADGSYIELIAFFEPSAEHRWWAPLLKGGGLVDFCMQTDNLRGDTAAFRQAGVSIEDPKPLTRVRPDGYTLSWVLSIPRDPHRGVAPFLIQDETPRHERVPPRVTHRNRVTGIGTVTVAVDDVEAVRPWYRSVLGGGGTGIERSDLEAAGARFTIGPHVFEFVAPGGSRSPLGDWLRARGPSPYAATLRSASGKTGLLDETKTMGARLALV